MLSAAKDPGKMPAKRLRNYKDVIDSLKLGFLDINKFYSFSTRKASVI